MYGKSDIANVYICIYVYLLMSWLGCVQTSDKSCTSQKSQNFHHESRGPFIIQKTYRKRSAPHFHKCSKFKVFKFFLLFVKQVYFYIGCMYNSKKALYCRDRKHIRNTQCYFQRLIKLQHCLRLFSLSPQHSSIAYIHRLRLNTRWQENTWFFDSWHLGSANALIIITYDLNMWSR